MSKHRGEDEEVSSSSDDEDYVPSEQGEEEVEDDGDEFDKCDVEDDFADEPVSKMKSEESKKISVPNVGEDEEEKKKRADALFEAFLADTDEPSTSYSSPSATASKSNTEGLESKTSAVRQENLDVFEEDIFAISGEEKRSEETAKLAEKNEADLESPSQKPQNLKRSASGLDVALNLISKKSKTSVLQKSQNDWSEFKTSEGIEDELSIHNRGKNGYIEKIDFLTRTDYRQFVNERDDRVIRRNKKH